MISKNFVTANSDDIKKMSKDALKGLAVYEHRLRINFFNNYCKKSIFFIPIRDLFVEKKQRYNLENFIYLERPEYLDAELRSIIWIYKSSCHTKMKMYINTKDYTTLINFQELWKSSKTKEIQEAHKYAADDLKCYFD